MANKIIVDNTLLPLHVSNNNIQQTNKQTHTSQKSTHKKNTSTKIIAATTTTTTTTTTTNEYRTIFLYILVFWFLAIYGTTVFLSFF